MVPLLIGLILLIILLLSREAAKSRQKPVEVKKENLSKTIEKPSHPRAVKFSDKVRVREFGARTGEYFDKLNDSALI